MDCYEIFLSMVRGFFMMSYAFAQISLAYLGARLKETEQSHINPMEMAIFYR